MVRDVAERALELDNVSAGYGETVVLEDITLTLAADETLSIIGRNGVGKSTLLATIMGHTTLHGGRIALHGKDISTLATYRRVWAGLGLVPQEREIFPSLTLRENLEVATRPGAWTLEKVFELFPRLAERAGNRGNQLSGGEQQMLAIGRALIGNPSVLLMDEPSEGLAPVIVEELARAMKRLTAAGGLALILVEQNSRLALDIAPRVVVMDRGQIVYDGAERGAARGSRQARAFDRRDEGVTGATAHALPFAASSPSKRAMKRSSNRILTTHVGSLIRPPALQEFLRAKQAGKPYDETAYQAVPDRIRSPRWCASRPRPASTCRATASSANRSAGRNMRWNGCPASSAARSRTRPPIRSSAAPTARVSRNSTPSSMRATASSRRSMRSASARSNTPGRPSCSATSTTSKPRSRT